MIWKCKDGTLVEISKMTDSHLLNTIRFLRRKAPRLMEIEIGSAYSVLGMLCEELDGMFCNEDIDMLDLQDPQDWIEDKTEMKEMLKELRKRKLTELPYET